MICRLRKVEPSFSSMNEKSFESRRVRTQPWMFIASMGAVVRSASLIEVGASFVISTLNVQRSKPNVQLWSFRFSTMSKCTAIQAAPKKL
jgi:hypothetical protein